MSTVPDGYANCWTPQKTADYLGLSVNTLAKWRSLQLHPDLEWFKDGRRVLYDPIAVKRWWSNRLKPRTGTHLEDCTRNQRLAERKQS